jgi:hypothetical protein
MLALCWLFAVLRHPEKTGAEKTPKTQRISKGFLPASPVQSSKLSTSAISARLCKLGGLRVGRPESNAELQRTLRHAEPKDR